LTCRAAARYQTPSGGARRSVRVLLRRIGPMKPRLAKFGIGQVVRHRKYPFRGVIYDVDPVFANTEEWWLSIPEDVRPSKDQPFYHLFAENAETEYVAYVSEQNLLPDESGAPIRHPQVKEHFVRAEDGRYRMKNIPRN
jgi:heat shock protein HspQ